VRISASSYSNTAPLIWSFLYGTKKGSVEVILDNAPSRSAALLAEERVDAALVPVIVYQTIPDLFVVPGVCVGSKKRVRSVCLVTSGQDLKDVDSVALDVSSKTSVAMTKIIFREFLDKEPRWIDHQPDIDSMLTGADCALLIGDPALELHTDAAKGLRKFDIVKLWRDLTGFGFVFAMWMTKRRTLDLDFASARDEGLAHLDEILANYSDEIELTDEEMREYLSENISFEIEESMRKGLELYFELAEKHGLIEKRRAMDFCDSEEV